MNILIVSQVIPQWYVDTIKHALGANWQCDIITGSKIKDPIIEAPSHDARSFISRFFCWIKFLVFMRIWVRNNKSRHYDLIFAISNPPINSYIGLLLKRIYNAPFLYMNWDLYPQVIEYGVRNFSGRIVSKVWHKWNNYSYPQIDRMLTIGQVVSESLNRDLKKKVHVSVLPISVDTDRIKPIAKDKNPFVIEYNLTDKFVVLYSGKMGMGHNIELILEASLLLCDYSDVKFVFIGEGPKFDVVKRHVLKYSSKNILLLPTQPEDIFPFSIACGDIGIVSQESEMAHLFMPSKTYSMLACGEAIIGIGSSHDDLKMLIEENKIGFSVVDNQASSIANDIKFLYDNRDLLNRMKETSRKLVESHYSIKVVENKYAELFKGLFYAK
jgi:glycosyltransferase involved in cell wall biosynthesis